MGYYILFALLMATVGVLLAGVVLMSVGGKVNQKYSNRLMRWRVMLQGLAIGLLALLFMAGDKG
ncbi:MAG: twin transmembrane helix small protein [Alphaproteobacteria bacterium]